MEWGDSNYGEINDAHNNYSGAFCFVWFPFYDFSKGNMTFITAISKFLQDDRNIIQFEFCSASPCAVLELLALPISTMDFFFFKIYQPSYCIYVSAIL